MTPEQMQMMQLQNLQEPTQELDPINEGLARTVNYMAKNGPVRPIQRGMAKVMTKTQYKEQMMNESAGLPSNLDEAARVMALEQKVQNVDLKLDQILGALVGQPLTPQVRPAVVPLPPQPLPMTQVVHPPHPTYPPPGNQMAPMTVGPTPPTSPPVSSIQPLQPPVSPETVPDPNEIPEKYYSQIKTPDGVTTIPQSKPIPMSLGSTGAAGYGTDQMGKDEILSLDDGPRILPFPNEPDSEPVHLVEEDQPPIVDKQLERQQILTDQVVEWLGQKDPHKFWRHFVGGSCNKNLSYNTWPKEFQGPFNERFGQMLKDPCFISNICGRILKMQNGHMVGPHIAGAFVTVIAGFLSFALIEV